MFKIGDRVRILPSAVEHGFNDIHIGTLATIISIGDRKVEDILKCHDGHLYIFHEQHIELVTDAQQPEQGNADDFKYEGTQHRPYGLEIIEFIPREKWLDNRLSEVKRAITMACQENFSIPTEWLDEYNELVRGK